MDALTSATTTRRDDLPAAIEWNKADGFSTFATEEQIRLVILLFDFQTATCGPSPPVCNQLAFWMLLNMDLEFRVRVVGLKGATHLNGREGVVCRMDFGKARFFVSILDDNSEVSVKFEKVERIVGDNYRRRSKPPRLVFDVSRVASSCSHHTQS